MDTLILDIQAIVAAMAMATEVDMVAVTVDMGAMVDTAPTVLIIMEDMEATVDIAHTVTEDMEVTEDTEVMEA